MGEIRVIGGIAKGRKLRSVPGTTTRPITDQVREALFNIIGGDIIDACFLDLFGGTGSVGIEALSRGARSAYFVDINQLAVKTITENLMMTSLVEKACVIRQNAFTYLEKKPDQEFDYIFIAPPQYQRLWEKALLSVDNNLSWLTDDAWIIVQIHPREYKQFQSQEFLHHLVEFDQRKYGGTLLVFYCRK